jgi:hypothetical protein
MASSDRPAAGGAAAAALLAAMLFWALPAGAAEPAAACVDFAREVRPLLSDRCFRCHGPDARSRRAGLRLDAREGALKELRGGRRAVVPGRPEESELLRRITAADPDERMPPAASNLSLDAAEIALLRRWIEEGADYRQHWAFLPPAAPEAPALDDGGWARGPIDHFILERLRAAGLEPAPEACRETLIRRLSFDLAGLPPSVDEIDAFLADRGPGAYERLVERLLAAPAWGERLAVDWLDVARWADTYGYQADADRDLSPWRDWVIRAFNENLPYDRFLTWQLAGDLLPGAGRDQVLATAFNRLHRQTNEGGSIEEEFRVEYVADRVHTMGTAFLGLTLECARCHDHKFDPISQRDYYRLFAYFDSIDESGLYSHFTQAVPTPTLLLYEEGVEEKNQELHRRIAAAAAELERVLSRAGERFAAWRAAAAGVTVPRPAAAFPFDEVAAGSTPDAENPERSAALQEGVQAVAGRTGGALRFDGDGAAVLKGAGAFGRADRFGFALWLRLEARAPRAVVFHRSRAWTDSGSRGYELVLDEGRPFFGLIHFWPGNAIAVRAREPLPLGRWTHLAIAYDGSSRAAGIDLYIDGEPAALEVIRDHLQKDIFHRREWGDADAGAIELTIGARFRDSGLKGGEVDDFLVFDRRLTAPEARLLAGGSPASGAESLLEHYLELHDEEHRAAREELQRLRREENDLMSGVREIMVMEELPERRDTRLLRRGAYDAPGEPVERGVPESLLELDEGLPPNRLGLARWMTDPRHPLTARVAANRAWRLHFGRGLAATVEDLGSQGELPSHPELLDWLARRLVESGWDLKALHREIVLSAAYRQSSRAGAAALAADPENRLISRGPSHRLSAEQVRDAALAASGLLSPRLGGRSVKPYQPEGLWEEAGTGKRYVQGKGEELYRRSLYTFWRRTAPPASMMAFDAPSREVCTARREVTSTPLQALVLLNDRQLVEAARVLGERLAREHPGDRQARIEAACRRLLGRRPEAREREVLERLEEEQLEHFRSRPEEAERLLAVGERPRDRALPAAEAAAAAVLCSALINHHEFSRKP